MNKFNRNGLRSLFFLIVTCFSTIYSTGSAIAAPKIEIEELRAILPPSVASTTAIYGVIKNTGDELDTLLKISSNAGMVMLHQTEVNSGQAQMNHIDTYVIKSGDALTLKPMSYHLMLMGINHDVVKENGQISLTLEFKKQGELVFTIPVSFE